MDRLDKARFYLRNMTIKRIANYFLVNCSLLLKSCRVYGKPLSLFIEPTNVCNLGCRLCPTGDSSLKRRKGFMGFDDFKRIMDWFGESAFSVTLWNYGEPFLNKNIIKMIRYAKAKGLKVITSANGYGFEDEMLLREIVESGLDELIVAVDGADAKTHCLYRVNSDFETLINGIKRLVEIRGLRGVNKPYIQMQFIVMKHNEHQIAEIKEMAGGLGVDELVLKTVNVYDNQYLAKRFVPFNPAFSRYRIDGGRYVSCMHEVKNKCDGLWIGMNIDWDGTVVPCCYDPHEKVGLGNVFEDGISIWNSKKFVAFRKQVLKDKKIIPLCANCPSNIGGFDIARIRF